MSGQSGDTKVLDIELPAEMVEVAKGLSRQVREATAELAFGAEPLDFLAALEEEGEPASAPGATQ
jgi:hypothetical protein